MADFPNQLKICVAAELRILKPRLKEENASVQDVLIPKWRRRKLIALVIVSVESRRKNLNKYVRGIFIAHFRFVCAHLLDGGS